MKFRHVSLLFLSVTPAFSNVHADPYDIQTLAAHLEQKLGNIQAEYQNVRNEKQLSHLWNTHKQQPNNLYLSFFGVKNVYSVENVESKTGELFPFEDEGSKKQLIEFISVFTSNNFLNMLFGNNFVDWLTAYGDEDSVIVEWNEEPFNDHWFSLRIQRKCFKKRSGEVLSPFEKLIGGAFIALDVKLVFAYDTGSNNIQFIGTKGTIVINNKEVKMNLPIYSPSSNASVPQNNSMDTD